MEKPYLLADSRPLVAWDADLRTGIGLSGAAYMLSAHSDGAHYYTVSAPEIGSVTENHVAIDDKCWDDFNKLRIVRESEIREAVRILIAGGEDLLTHELATEARCDIIAHAPMPGSWIPDGSVIEAIRAGRAVEAAIPCENPADLLDEDAEPFSSEDEQRWAVGRYCDPF